jgi:hypothetical protein
MRNPAYVVVGVVWAVVEAVIEAVVEPFPKHRDGALEPAMMGPVDARETF